MNAQRQDEMVDQLEQAVAMSFGPLETDVREGRPRRRRPDRDGARAPIPARAGRSAPPRSRTRSFDDPELGTRFDRLMLDLDRMNLMRIAAEQGPLRLAGRRRLPLHQRLRLARRGGMHAGIDLAAPRGTPIFATADGVVADRRAESGYGNVVRVRHEFGFETVYAHLSKIRVRPGQQYRVACK